MPNILRVILLGLFCQSAAFASGFFIDASLSQAGVRQLNGDLAPVPSFGADLGYRVSEYIDLAAHFHTSRRDIPSSLKRTSYELNVVFRPYTSSFMELSANLGVGYHQFTKNGLAESQMGLGFGPALDFKLYGARVGVFAGLHILDDLIISSSFQTYGVRLGYFFDT